MYEEENLSPAEQALESALGQLKPIANTLNRDAFMFNAGRASVGRKRPWQILSGVLTIILLCSIFIRPELNNSKIVVPSAPEQNNFQIAQTQKQPVEADFEGSLTYPALRENVIKYGMDALQLQESARHSEAPRSRKQWLDSMLSS
jgi:hypothetical protein